MSGPPLRRSPGPLATLSSVALAAALLLITGCSSSSEPSASTTVRPTPISRLNTGVMRLARTSFCTRLSQRAVDQAVGGDAGRGKAWKNGDTAEVENGVNDVVHESGCRWTHDDGSARAWVFARSVSTAQANAVIAKTAKRSGCTSAAGPDFGSPSQRQTCSLKDGATRVRVAGLFGDTWLSCEVSSGSGAGADAVSVSRRTDAWCVQVANALNTTR